MKIRIKNLDDVIELVKAGKNSFSIVSIRSTNIPHEEYEPIDELSKNYNSILAVYFDDVEFPEDPYQMATEDQIRQILDWTKDKDDILVHCTAGVSRSSAVAYLIACSKVGISAAIKVLNYWLHDPNKHVLKLGAIILNDNEVYNSVVRWHEENRGKYKF